jgi:hypothetical protein
VRKHLESKLQRSCVKWFDLQYPKMRQLLFAIPNGGARSKIEAGIMKGEGVRAGVADMFLAVPRQNVPEPYNEELYNGLFIEFKYGKGKQSDTQKSFQAAVDKQGFGYEIVTDFDSFKNLIESYLN